jgi:hypothetical protein
MPLNKYFYLIRIYNKNKLNFFKKITNFKKFKIFYKKKNQNSKLIKEY